VEDLFSSIGYGGITANQVLQKLLEEYRKHNKEKFRQEIEFPKKDDRHKKGRTLDKGVKVKGVDNLLVRFSRCCNPVPGDEIIGYITRGRGISIHRKDCPNVKQHFDEKERLIEVEWDESRNASYSVEIQVSANDRGGLLSDVVNTINDLKTMIIAVNARTTRDRIALIDMTLEIKNKEHLQLIIQKLKRIKDVFKVNRILPN
jgi:GTP pyrophosphokinase